MTPRVRKADARFKEVPGYPNLELDTKSGYYYVRKYIAGKGELFASTRSKKKMVAKTIAETKIAEMIGRKPGLRNRRIRLAALGEPLLKDLKEQTETLDEDGHPLRRLSTYTGKDKVYIPLIVKLFGEVCADEIDEQFWKSWVKKTGRKLGRNLGDIAKYLSLFLTYAFEEKYIGRKPRIKNPDRQRNNAIVYENDQIIAFYQNAEPTLQDLIVLAAENPLRPHENCEVRWEMVFFEKDEEGREVVIYRLPASFTKTREARELQLSPRSASIIRRRHAERSQGSPYVFPAPQNPNRPLSRKVLGSMWARMKERAKITTPCKFHWLRHSFYSKALLESQTSVAKVSEAGGTSIATLQKRYLKSTARKTREVAAAVNLDFDREGKE
jgi:integrase